MVRVAGVECGNLVWGPALLLWRRTWQLTPVLLPGKSHGWRGLVDYSPWGCEELDTSERFHFHFSLSCIGEGNGNPLQYSCLENPRDRVVRWAAVYGVAQSWTRLMWLSSSNSCCCSCVIMKMSYQLLCSQYFNFSNASGCLQLMDINEIILMSIVTLVVVFLCFM